MKKNNECWLKPNCIFHKTTVVGSYIHGRDIVFSALDSARWSIEVILGSELHHVQSGNFRLRNGHFGLIAVFVGHEGQRHRFAVGRLPRDGALRRGAENVLAQLLLAAGFAATDAVTRLVAAYRNR